MIAYQAVPRPLHPAPSCVEVTKLAHLGTMTAGQKQLEKDEVQTNKCGITSS